MLKIHLLWKNLVFFCFLLAVDSLTESVCIIVRIQRNALKPMLDHCCKLKCHNIWNYALKSTVVVVSQHSIFTGYEIDLVEELAKNHVTCNIFNKLSFLYSSLPVFFIKHFI